MTIPRYAIVGAGFSGIAVAVQLLKQLKVPAEVCLVNRNHRFGRGLAYGTRSASHLLNVPAGRMGLEPEDEAGFHRFLQRQGLAYKPGDFVPRKLYGEYLEEALEAAQQACAPGVHLEMVQSEAVGLQQRADGVDLELANGRVLAASHVVLALGNFPPRWPTQVPESARGVIGDPWMPAALEGVAADSNVLLVGSGLTAFDLVLALLDRGHTGTITMASRRGLLPQSHRALETPPAPGLVPQDFLAGVTSIRAQLRAVRDLLRRAEAEGHDWRDVIGGLRGHTPRLWQQLDARSRGQFLRHLAPYWDTRRHRAAPEIHARVRAALETGQVRLLAGRISGVEPDAGGLRVTFRPRGVATPVTQAFQAVINCTGPSSDVRLSRDRLIHTLDSAGSMQPDTLHLGIEVDPEYRVLGRDGQPAARVRYVGPLLKAQFWEATAVPELRMHSRKLVQILLSSQDIQQR